MCAITTFAHVLFHLRDVAEPAEVFLAKLIIIVNLSTSIFFLHVLRMLPFLPHTLQRSHRRLSALPVMPATHHRLRAPVKATLQLLILTIFDVYFLLDTAELVCYVLLPDRV